MDLEENRAKVLAAPVPVLSQATEQDMRAMLKRALEIRDESLREQTLSAIATRLTTFPRAKLYALWREVIHVLARRPRQEVLVDLSALAPVLFTLGGKDAIVKAGWAIVDVGRWWP